MGGWLAPQFFCGFFDKSNDVKRYTIDTVLAESIEHERAASVDDGGGERGPGSALYRESTSKLQCSSLCKVIFLKSVSKYREREPRAGLYSILKFCIFAKILQAFSFQS